MPNVQRWTRSRENSGRAGGGLEPEQRSLLLPWLPLLSPVRVSQAPGQMTSRLLPLALSVVMVKVCIERIQEIKKGEEDDLSKY